jgi:hypothetical protein
MDKRRASLYDVQWQLFRLGLKGRDTEEKLEKVEEYYMEYPSDFRGYRVYNYLDAIVNRGGMPEGPLRMDAVTMMDNIKYDHHDFPRSNFMEWSWYDVLNDLVRTHDIFLKELQADFKTRNHLSGEARRFLYYIELVLEHQGRDVR